MTTDERKRILYVDWFSNYEDTRFGNNELEVVKTEDHIYALRLMENERFDYIGIHFPFGSSWVNDFVEDARGRGIPVIGVTHSGISEDSYREFLQKRGLTFDDLITGMDVGKDAIVKRFSSKLRMERIA